MKLQLSSAGGLLSKVQLLNSQEISVTCAKKTYVDLAHKINCKKIAQDKHMSFLRIKLLFWFGSYIILLDIGLYCLRGCEYDKK